MDREEWWQLKILKFSEFPQEAAVSVTSNSFGKFGPPEQKWKVQGYFADVKRVIYFLSLGCMQKYDIKHLQFLLSITLSFMFSSSIKKCFPASKSCPTCCHIHYSPVSLYFELKLWNIFTSLFISKFESISFYSQQLATRIPRTTSSLALMAGY